jgi:putative hydrolase of the HAD superfamily
MIKAIIFDVDQVLVNIEGKYFTHHLEDEFGIPRSVTLPFFENEFSECIIGKKDLKKILPKYMKIWGWKGTLEELLHYWHSKEHTLNEPLMDELDGYKEKDLKLYLATNQEKYRMEYILNDMGFGKIFDYAFASAHLGESKPAQAYFHKILEKLVVYEPQELLFWDDRPENVAAAKEVGLHAEQYQNFTHFKQVMAEKYDL